MDDKNIKFNFISKEFENMASRVDLLDRVDYLLSINIKDKTRRNFLSSVKERILDASEKELKYIESVLMGMELNGERERNNIAHDLKFPGQEERERIERLEREIRRLMERPKIYEREASKKLDEINNKFSSLMNIKTKDFNLTEKISKIEKLTEELEKLKADTQSLVNDISTVKLANHYKDAKNKYKSNVFNFIDRDVYFYSCKIFKKNRKKYPYLRFLLLPLIPFDCILSSICSLLDTVFRNVFQKKNWLYFFFLTSLFGFGFLYWEFISGNELQYKYLPLSLPFIWSSWFFQRKINIKDNLYEIYNHKQNVMETYVAFKNSQYNFNAEDKMEDVLLEAVKKYPSDCMGKNNSTIIESVLDRIQGCVLSKKISDKVKEEVDELFSKK